MVFILRMILAEGGLKHEIYFLHLIKPAGFYKLQNQ